MYFSAFGAYDADTWTIQWILNQLGYGGGMPIDGLWGSQTFGAVSDFRQINGLPPANDITKAGAVDDSFRTALWGQALNAGLNVPTGGAAGSGGGASAGGGGGAGVQVYPTVPGSAVPAAPGAAGMPSSTLLWVGAGLLGLAAVVGLSGKKRR